MSALRRPGSARWTLQRTQRTQRCAATWLLAAALAGGGCAKDQPAPTPAAQSESQAEQRDPLVGGPYPTLLLAKAQFSYPAGGAGRTQPVPGAAKLVILREAPTGWQTSVLEDRSANVFHNALLLPQTDGRAEVLTISGTAAALKLWHWENDKWAVDAPWRPTFGGKWDRLRDVEVGDVTGDGVAELVVVTHDQGVIAVLNREGAGWAVREVDRAPDTFVHEVEIGDVDGDGVNEFFATPSQPNAATLASQPGSIVMFHRDGAGFTRSVVESFARTHAKEILAFQPAGAARATLWAAVEAVTEMRDGKLATVQPVDIREYRLVAGAWRSRSIATLPDTQCRVLVTGDLDHDGEADVVATGMRSGVWWLRPDLDGAWTLAAIDRQSSGFEHAAWIGDLDGDGRDELYVAADEQGELRRYRWNGSGFDRDAIAPLPKNEITFHISGGSL